LVGISQFVLGNVNISGSQTVSGSLCFASWNLAIIIASPAHKYRFFGTFPTFASSEREYPNPVIIPNNRLSIMGFLNGLFIGMVEGSSAMNSVRFWSKLGSLLCGILVYDSDSAPSHFQKLSFLLLFSVWRFLVSEKMSE
jgi:hypothetical protein